MKLDRVIIRNKKTPDIFPYQTLISVIAFRKRRDYLAFT